jgi:hypothetical protein
MGMVIWAQTGMETAKHRKKRKRCKGVLRRGVAWLLNRKFRLPGGRQSVGSMLERENQVRRMVAGMRLDGWSWSEM